MGATVAAWAAALGLLGVGLLLGPSTPGGEAPTLPPLAWLAPVGLMVVGVGALLLLVRRALPVASRWGAPWALALVAVVWSGFMTDKLLIELSPHWAQKHVIAAYFRNRKGPEEPLIAWQLYWRGENLYSRNVIYSSPDPLERTVFLGDKNAEKMQTYFASHAGKRVFFVVERNRFESLRSLLPAASKQSLSIVDQSNNKLYLASAQL
jgi:hypothetical protein